MKRATACLVVCFAVFLAAPMALGDEGEDVTVVSGKVGVAAKYNTNPDLTSGVESNNPLVDEEVDDAYITEVSASLLLTPLRASPWHFDLELFGLSDLYLEDISDSWVIGRGNLGVGYEWDGNSISLTDEARYFSEPDDTEFDNLRNAGSLAYQRVFSGLWQAAIGYENLVLHYMENDFLTYLANGGFVEVRNTWRPAFSTYYRYGFHYYSGRYNEYSFNRQTRATKVRDSDLAGTRHTGEIGFESFFARRNSLVGAYTFQLDDNSDPDVWQVGLIRGEDESLESDAEFNFMRHKALLLYSHRFNDRFTLSLYDEFIYKRFFDRPATVDAPATHRTDLLLLASVWFTARLYDELYAKTRYLFRLNESTAAIEDFQDHVVSLGLEYRF